MEAVAEIKKDHATKLENLAEEMDDMNQHDDNSTSFLMRMQDRVRFFQFYNFLDHSKYWLLCYAVESYKRFWSSNVIRSFFWSKFLFRRFAYHYKRLTVTQWTHYLIYIELEPRKQLKLRPSWHVMCLQRVWQSWRPMSNRTKKNHIRPWKHSRNSSNIENLSVAPLVSSSPNKQEFGKIEAGNRWCYPYLKIKNWPRI